MTIERERTLQKWTQHVEKYNIKTKGLKVAYLNNFHKLIDTAFPRKKRLQNATLSKHQKSSCILAFKE